MQTTLADTLSYIPKPKRRPVRQRRSLQFFLRLALGPFKLRVRRVTVFRTESAAAITAEANRLVKSGSKVSVVASGGFTAA